MKKPYIRFLIMAGLFAGFLPYLVTSPLDAWNGVEAAAGKAVPAFRGEPGPADRPDFRRDTLRIVTRDGRRLSFLVEVAETPRERDYGLMFRERLPDDEGMLFFFAPPRKVGFWMKNTGVSLDVIFVGPDGKVLSVAPDRTPFSLQRIESPGPVRAVLEIGGGLAAERGITRGAALVHPAFASPEPRGGEGG